MRDKIFTIAHVPSELHQKWLQHLRDFDAANPGCHFEIAIDAPDVPLADAVARLVVEPNLSFTKIFMRGNNAKD